MELVLHLKLRKGRDPFWREEKIISLFRKRVRGCRYLRSLFGLDFFMASTHGCFVEMVVIWLVWGMPETEFRSPLHWQCEDARSSWPSGET